MAEHFQVSREAAARTYVDYHDEPLAIVFAKNNIVHSVHKNKDFPFLNATYGKLIPNGAKVYGNRVQDLQKSPFGSWVDQDGVTVYEQTLRKGEWTLTILWADIPEEIDLDEDRTSKQRWQERNSRWT